jgi:hypothetical protein
MSDFRVHSGPQPVESARLPPDSDLSLRVHVTVRERRQRAARRPQDFPGDLGDSLRNSQTPVAERLGVA